MRVFLTACLAVVVLGVVAVLLLGSAQQPSGYAYSTSGARPEASWVWREPIDASNAPQGSSMSKTGEASRNCRSGIWTYIVTDFRGTPTADPVCRS